MTNIVKFSMKTLKRVRKRLYSEEKLAKRAAEEAERKRAAAEERAQIEAEEEAKRQEEAERVRLEEEVKRKKVEEEKRRQEEERRALEEKVAELTEATVTQSSRIESEEQSHSATKTLLAEEKDARAATDQKLMSTEDKVKAGEEALAALQIRLDEERQTLQDKMATLTESAEGDNAALMADMAKTVNEKAAVENQLGDAQEQVRATQGELEQVNTRLAELKESSVAKHAELTAQCEATAAELAIKCQESQLKLRSIYGKFKKDSELLALVYSDISYENMVRVSSKVGMLQKQGGSNTKKWDARQVIIADSFFAQYAGRKDKHPKGIIRMDQARAEVVDLSGIAKQFGIKITDLKSAREYFYSASSEADRTAWLDAMEKAESNV